MKGFYYWAAIICAGWGGAALGFILDNPTAGFVAGVGLGTCLTLLGEGIVRALKEE